MASRRRKDDRPSMIHCEFCGEDYSSTYKHCPFCDEMEDQDYDQREDYDEDELPPRSRGGKRLVTNTRGGGYGGSPSPLRTVGTVLSLALIVAAVIIVITIIMPLVSKGHQDPGDTVPSAAPTPSATVPPAASETPAPPASEPPAAESPENTPPAGQTATGFALDQKEFSFSDRYPDPITVHVTFTPAGSAGTVTWTSSDPSVAAVDGNGVVRPGSVRGNATITASMPGAPDQTILVYNQTTSSGGGTSSGTPSGGTSTGSLSLNKTDFTFSAKDNPPVQMRVNGTSSTPSWSIGNTAVASISADGVVKPVGAGTTTITCKVDGQTLTCIVRCSF